MSHVVDDALLQPIPVVESDDSVSLAVEIARRALCAVVAVRVRGGYGILAATALEAGPNLPELVGDLTLQPAMLLSRGESTATALSRMNLSGTSLGVVRLGDGLMGMVTTDELKLLL